MQVGKDPKPEACCARGEDVSSLYSTKRCKIDLHTYKKEVSANIDDVWELARGTIKKAQLHQWSIYDQQARVPKYGVGERVFCTSWLQGL